ncbi:AHH domain-containing protein [Nevskia sp.]|uniref:AHH domain-containing protein n=1 Tax=Nevskia sp. TaxID=1929292 RepID=UPI0025E7415F|nr:AHH domain-containing protein [Nevskia sp.]
MDDITDKGNSMLGPDDFAVPTNGIVELTVSANHIAVNDEDTNAYEIRNARIVASAKDRVRYRNGITLPNSAKKLLADSERNVRHSRILARNIKNNTGQEKSIEADAHHIVARLDIRADRSRRYLFDWGIGINDADNGVYLPKRVGSPTNISNASAHEKIHTGVYFLEVIERLRAIAGETSQKARLELRSMKQDLVAGVFPY